MASDELLRREIDHLGRLVGNVIRQFAGDDQFELVEEVRRGARRFCEGIEGAGDELDRVLATLSEHQLRSVVRAFTTFLELANLAEDRQRVRALRSRDRAKETLGRKESVAAAISELHERGLTWEETAEVLRGIDIELVFTAHPTEAKRKSLRAKLREIRRLLSELDGRRLLPRERSQLETALHREIIKLWQTDFVRARRPSVLEEVQRGLSFQDVLWETAPTIRQNLREAVAHYYPEAAKEPLPQMLRFGSWMGGDRDGHPYVTPSITAQTCLWLRQAALQAHIDRCSQLADSLSLSQQESPHAADLASAIDQALHRWPRHVEEMELIPPRETYRRWLKIIRWRLEQTLAAPLDGVWPEGVYHAAVELKADVQLIRDALAASGNDQIAEAEVVPWLDQIDIFGFHTTRLDIRQHAGVYREVMDEIWLATQFLEPDQTLDEPARLKLLTETMAVAPNLDPVGLSQQTSETLQLFSMLRRQARRFGMATLGGHVISMTTAASDMLTVQWLWKWSERVDGGDPHDPELLLPVVPLLETIGDLDAAVDILVAALDTPEYRDYVRQLGDSQMVMIGYSDSTKDGGYLSSSWALYRVQIQLHEVATARGVRTTFFHGRGGSLGRGGGPAARAILSLPSETFHGSLRLTEQGEVLAERYDDPVIAHRHLEQVVWSVMMAATHRASHTPSQWHEAMDRVAEASLKCYRGLVDHGAFLDFFRSVTPISEIERLPIGSRPAKRKGGGSIEDLRAIPWVFSWTQCRCLLPAWYGLGTGLAAELERPEGEERLQHMYANWPFFSGTIDNSMLALAKSNMPVFRRYLDLASDTPGVMEVADKLITEFELAKQMVLRITGSENLLDTTPWLQRSIQVRNRYVDPLNLVQVELLRRRKHAAERGEQDNESLEELSQLTIKGVAAGLRTTG